jgi:hypothetical protein
MPCGGAAKPGGAGRGGAPGGAGAVGKGEAHLRAVSVHEAILPHLHRRVGGVVAYIA